MIELAEEFVEQVAGCGSVAVTVFTPLAVMPASRFEVRGSRECPHPAGVGQPVVLDMAVGTEIERPDARVIGADPA